MPKSLGYIAATFILSALAVALFRPVEAVSAAPPEEMKFDKGKALRITRKQGGEPLYLSRPEAVRIGDRSFLSGYRVGADVAVYVPVSDVDLIEEFASVEALKKLYRVGDAPNPTTSVTPTTEQK